MDCRASTAIAKEMGELMEWRAHPWHLPISMVEILSLGLISNYP